MTQPLNIQPVNSMDPEIKLEFVAALRSGDYAQGFNALHRNGCFCVMGVLTDLAAHRGIVEWYPSRNGRWGVKIYEIVEDNILAPRVARWAGVKELFGDIRFGNRPGDTLIALNDDDRLTFEQIADIIEERL